MLDGNNRVIDYLRVSVTDRCNLRCVYCMPAQGVAPIPHEEILSYEEILRICRCAAALGIKRIKLTGGEPLVRRGIAGLVEGIAALEGIEEVTMTSNGVLVGPMAHALAHAGLKAVNISLDTLDPARYASITRGGSLSPVLKAIDRALDAGLQVKVNCVPMRDGGAEQVASVASLAKNAPVHVRFIELMPIGEGDPGAGMAASEVKQVLKARCGALTPCEERLGNGPAEYYALPGYAGRIGLIHAVSRHFCSSCNRVRLTSTGFLKLCLHYSAGTDLRALLRGGADDDALIGAMRAAIAQKPARHSFDQAKQQQTETRRMVQIGG